MEHLSSVTVWRKHVGYNYAVFLADRRECLCLTLSWRVTSWTGVLGGADHLFLFLEMFFKGLEKDLEILSLLTEKQGEKMKACPLLQDRLPLLFSVGSLENTNHCA